MKKSVTLIDYGIGNLLSVRRAFEQCGAEVEVTDSPNKIANAEKLILPGVGAFAVGMAGLRARGLVEPIKEFVRKDRPFMGICLGMQMMLDYSEEFGRFEGLGLIPGGVAVIPDTTLEGEPHKIPHIGWNELVLPEGRLNWKDTPLEEVSRGAAVYFVHSYTAIPEVQANRLADCYYNGRLISAAIQKDYIYGFQFHPEKSGEVGLRIIRSFLQI